jgi:hypothetical protein
MNEVLRIQVIIDECDIHAQRLQDAYSRLLPLFPFTEKTLVNMNKDDLAYLDMLIGRFAKLQDTIGGRLFPEVIIMLDPKFEGRTHIDILNRLEKSNLLKSAKEWKIIRDFRNKLTHEYPNKPEIVVENINKSLNYIQDLLAYWKTLKPQVMDIIDQYQKKFA